MVRIHDFYTKNITSNPTKVSFSVKILLDKHTNRKAGLVRNLKNSYHPAVSSNPVNLPFFIYLYYPKI